MITTIHNHDNPFIQVYPMLRGLHVFEGGLSESIRSQVDRFHSAVQGKMQEVVSNNSKYGIHLEETKFGTGVFNGSSTIDNRLNEPIAGYICALSTLPQYKSDRDFTYGFSEVNIIGERFVMDGKFTVDGRQTYNGVYFNHSCTPNCYATTHTETETGIKYILFYADRPIKPGEEMTIDYNEGVPTDQFGRDIEQGYWTDIDDLELHGELRKYLIKCGCNGGWCPKYRGLDLRVTRPAEAELL